MSIRNILLFCIFGIMILFIAASGWWSLGGLASFQRTLAKDLHRELLNEGATQFVASARQLATTVAMHPATGAPLELLAALKGADAETQVLVLQADGTPMAGWEPDPALAALIPADPGAALERPSVEGAQPELVADNFEAVVEGAAGDQVPAIVYLRALPERGVILGLGRVQRATGIRLETIGETATRQFEQFLRRGAGVYIALAIVALALLWEVLQFFFFRPLARTMALAQGTEAAPAIGRLTWARFREYAGRVALLEREKATLRSKLEHEIEARFQAEEERDHLRGNLKRELLQAQGDLRAQAERRLQECQAAIMGREARVLGLHLRPRIEAALAALGEESGATIARDRLAECLSTVDALAAEKAPEPAIDGKHEFGPWLESVVDEFSRRRSVPVVTSISPEASVAFEPVALRQAVEYVLENAAGAARGGAAVQLDAARDGDHVEIRVVDNGEGIPDDVRPHVFVPFFSADAQAGGLGLSITRSVVEKHGGSLMLHSESDKGTAVIIRLPARESGKGAA